MNWLEMPRHDPEAERMVLGGLLQGNSSDILAPQHFYVPAHEAIYSAFVELTQQMDKPGQVEIAKHLRKKNLYEGDMRTTLTEVAGKWVPVDTFPFWVAKLEDARKLRVMRLAYLQSLELDGAEAVERIEQGVLEASASEETKRLFTGAEIADLADARLKERLENPQKVTGLDLGFPVLSEKTFGVSPGDLVLVAAATSHGKSAFAQNVVAQLGVQQKRPVVYLNTEMGESKVTDRLLAILTGIEVKRITTGFINAAEKDVLTDATRRLREAPIVVSDALPDLSPQKAMTLARKYKRQGAELVIFDYIGRMELGLGGKLQEYQILEQITKGLKQIAQQLKIAVMVLAQLHEESGWLAGSKRMKNEADVFLKLVPVDDEDKELWALFQRLGVQDQANYALLLEKNRNGEADVVIPLVFDKPRLMMWEAHK